MDIKSSGHCYRTTSWPQYNQGLKARLSLMVGLDRKMRGLAEPTGKMLSDAAIQFCLSTKYLFNWPRHQAFVVVQNLGQLGCTVADFSHCLSSSKTLQVLLNYRPSTQPLKLLVDRTRTKFLGEDEWKCKEHGLNCCRTWSKVDFSIDVHMLGIWATEVTNEP